MIKAAIRPRATATAASAIRLRPPRPCCRRCSRGATPGSGLTFCVDVLIVLLLACGADRLPPRLSSGRFRPATGLFQLLASGPEADGVPDPGTARGVGRGLRGFP